MLGGIALGLGLERDWFARHLTADPTVLFRVFHYPPGDTESWGVGEHTDYGLITLLAQDHHGGLQVRSRDAWIDVPADPYVFVVNIGDMLERMTRGGYRSNPHRVRNLSGADRLSFPLFLDPSWDATVTPLPEPVFGDLRGRRRRATAGTGRACTRGRASTATTSPPRWPRSSPSSPPHCSDPRCQAATLRRMTQRHFAICRSRVKPKSSNKVSGPVWKYAPRCGGRPSTCSG